MRKIDVNARRELDIALHGLTGTDGVYTFYYDETNNIRRLHVTAEGFNVKEPLCFVLGGIAHHGPPRTLDFAELRRALGLQPSVRELKLKHLGSGEARNLLASPKVEAFLDWIAGQGILVHYSAVDPLYWATIDIIDSLISNESMSHMLPFDMKLKADLFTVLLTDIDDVAELFHRYSYPNVGDENRHAFIGELLRRLEEREGVLPHFDFYMLKGVLQGGAGNSPLIYLQNELPHRLLDSFVDFYVQRLCLFKNAHHILDAEPSVQDRLRTLTFINEGDELAHFRFVDSQTEAGVQMSDALVGLFGKLFSYVTRTPTDQLAADRRELTPIQVRTLGKLNALMDQSQNVSAALLHQVASLNAMHAAQRFFEGEEHSLWRLI